MKVLFPAPTAIRAILKEDPARGVADARRVRGALPPFGVAVRGRGAGAAGAHGEHLAETVRNGSPRNELAERVAAVRAELTELSRAEAVRPVSGAP